MNLNKVALVRNVGSGRDPSVTEAAQLCLEAGAGGITVHPRPDQRHTRPADVRDLARVIRSNPGTELNIEGNPVSGFVDLVRQAAPAQCTLVPDDASALTSDHGWDLLMHGERLRPLIRHFRELGIRVSLFVEPDCDQIREARSIGADRVELYTEPYARVCDTDAEQAILGRFVRAAAAARDVGLGVNAGHDLNLVNLGRFVREVPEVREVSIGHALVAHALDVGLQRAVADYLQVLAACDTAPAE